MSQKRTGLCVIVAAGGTAAIATAPTDPPAETTAPPLAQPEATVTIPDEPYHSGNIGDKSSYVAQFIAFYPTSTLTARMDLIAGQTCFVCHDASAKSAPANCYKVDLETKINGDMNIAQALAAIDGDDSDGDGYANGLEINYVRTDLPGEVGYNPGLIGPTGTSPCSATPTVPVTNQPETPTCYACDCDASTGLAVCDIFDFLCFQDSFVKGEQYACDCDTSTGIGVCDIFDFLCFQDDFVGGCP